MMLPVIGAIALLVLRFWRNTRELMQEPEARGLVYSVFFVIGTGTLIFSAVEGWELLDAMYFTVITLTTVGYGDFSPQTDLGKIFAIVYILTGLGLIGSFISLLADRRRERIRQRVNVADQTDDKEIENQEE